MQSRNIHPSQLKVGDLVRNLAIKGYVTSHPWQMKSGEWKFKLSDRWQQGYTGVQVWVGNDRELELIKRPRIVPHKPK